MAGSQPLPDPASSNVSPIDVGNEGRGRSSAGTSPAEVFVSYASRDRPRVLEIVEQLRASGVSVWLDQQRIPGGASYGPEIVRGIRDCSVLLLLCSDAALRSRNVNQELRLAWKYQKPYLPLLLEPVSFTEQVEYWLEGWQWIEVLSAPPATWLPAVLDALARSGVAVTVAAKGADDARPVVEPAQPPSGLAGLRAVARLTDRLWPLPAERVPRTRGAAALRDLGAPQDDLAHRFRLGSRVGLAIELEQPGHLLLLDEGPSGTLYCLCPSWFAPESRLPAGRTYLPQAGARYDAFEVTGRPGREHLLAIVSDEPLGLDWLPTDSRTPARVLSAADLSALLERLDALPVGRWMALATYFDVDG